MASVSIQYENYKFTPPSRISLVQYNQYKIACHNDSGFNFGIEDETFFGHWSWLWKILAVIFGIALIAACFDQDIGVACLVIGGLFACPLLIKFLLEAPSFALYLKEKRGYFYKMKKAIIIAESYEHFCTVFPQREAYNKW